MRDAQRDFEVTSVSTVEVGEKVAVRALERLLNEGISLKSYGAGIKKIFFTFIAVPATNTMHENEVFYRQEDKVLEVALKLDYDKLLQANEADAFEMMKKLFLSLFDFTDELKIPDFRFNELRKSLEEVFN